MSAAITPAVLALHIKGIIIYADTFGEGLVLSDWGEVEMIVLMTAVKFVDFACIDPTGGVDGEPRKQCIGGERGRTSGSARDVTMNSLTTERSLAFRKVTVICILLMVVVWGMANVKRILMVYLPMASYTLARRASTRLPGKSLEAGARGRLSRTQFKGIAFHCLPNDPWKPLQGKFMR